MLDNLRIFDMLLAVSAALLGISLFIRFRSRRWIYLVVLKMLANSCAPAVALMGAVAAILGVISQAPLAILAGAFGGLASILYVIRVTQPQPGFDQTFGPGWQAKMSPEMKARCLPQRWTWHLSYRNRAVFEPDVRFWTIPDGQRPLLCDLWQPHRELHARGWD
jgi:hypothetical protein